MNTSLAPAEQVEMWSRMLLIRRFEELLVRVGGETDGWYHTGIGQEGTAAAIATALAPTDYSNTTHRNHAHALARGVPPRAALAEIFGRATGVNRGFGGSMHIVSPEHGIVANSAMVGGSIPAMVGTALASKLRGSGEVAVACFGDGGVAEGAVYESLCLASLWQVPILFVCENDRTTEMTLERGTGSVPTREVADIPRAFDIVVRAVDGSDVLMVHAMLAAAVEQTRRDHRPVFIEVRTQPWPGKPTDPTELPGGATDLAMICSASAPTGQTSWQVSRDPLALLLRDLIARGVLTVAEATTIDDQIAAELEDTLEFARTSPWPSPQDAFALAGATTTSGDV